MCGHDKLCRVPNSPPVSIPVSKDFTPTRERLPPKPTILLGKTLTGIVSNVQPQQADEVSWKFRCANQNTGWQLAIDQPELTKSFCAGKVGDHLIEANVRVGTDSAIKSVAIEVLGPTTLAQVPSTMPAKSDTGPPLFSLEHRFRLVRGTTPIGSCYKSCAHERSSVFDSVMNIWPPEPTNWEHTGCDSDTSPEFYFHSPDVVDTKVVEVLAVDFANAAVGDIFRKYRQRVGVTIKKCSGDMIMATEFFEFHVKKASATEITHELQP